MNPFAGHNKKAGVQNNREICMYYSLLICLYCKYISYLELSLSRTTQKKSLFQLNLQSENQIDIFENLRPFSFAFKGKMSSMSGNSPFIRHPARQTQFSQLMTTEEHSGKIDSCVAGVVANTTVVNVFLYIFWKCQATCFEISAVYVSQRSEFYQMTLMGQLYIIE